jgi:dolichol-phosphate mannosyltransferase
VIIDHLRTYEDRAPYLRGIVASIGYAQIGIPYDRAERVAGRSKFSLAKLLALSIDGICSQSTKPLQYITFFGFGASIVTALLIVVYLGIYLFSADTGERGFTTLVLLVLASTGINAAFIGLIGEYVGRIYSTVRRGPTTIVAERIEAPSSVLRNDETSPSNHLRQQEHHAEAMPTATMSLPALPSAKGQIR